MSFGTLKTVTIDRDGVFVDINETDLKDTDVVVTQEMINDEKGRRLSEETEAHEMNDAPAKPKPKTKTKR